MKKIVIIEDEPDLAWAVAETLRRENYDVRIAPDATAGLNELSLDPPDLVILDVILPGRDGWEVLDDMKKHDAWRTIPVLILSNLDAESRIGHMVSAERRIEYVVKAEADLDSIVARAKALVTPVTPNRDESIK